ncbi:MAG: amidohydrolase family protein [Gemmatimonadetes bacterium]|nr:amidohydrolase family protein [Gemmatimonadota bacterium]MYK53728.1 amidohydrolase family protein [Gemmatimonadota bacterium]
MATNLSEHIEQTALCDTHEHLRREPDWIDDGPDVLQDLFGNYVPADLITAGASQEALRRLTDASDPDLVGRFEGVRAAWEATQYTGYGEAVRRIVTDVYGFDELTPDVLAPAQEKLTELRTPGGRYNLLREVANLDHIQTDDSSWPCDPDESGPDFFLYDLSWAGFCSGQIDQEAIAKDTGIAVVDLDSLQKAMEAIFEKHAPCAIAVKAQHAYNRTLNWQARARGDVERALYATLSSNNNVSESMRLCLGDWCWARGVELTIEHNLPFKIHTGYYAGNNRMPVDRIKAGNLCALLARYLDARFVLMHIAYPYSDELIALTKHYKNVWADLCWAWSINPYASSDFVRRFIHGAPINKLFVFGGDTRWPTSAAAYAFQTRFWLDKTLEAEVEEGYLTESQAMHIASRVMYDNQYECFDLEGTRNAIYRAMGE